MKNNSVLTLFVTFMLLATFTGCNRSKDSTTNTQSAIDSNTIQEDEFPSFSVSADLEAFMDFIEWKGYEMFDRDLEHGIYKIVDALQKNREYSFSFLDTYADEELEWEMRYSFLVSSEPNIIVRVNGLENAPRYEFKLQGSTFIHSTYSGINGQHMFDDLYDYDIHTGIFTLQQATPEPAFTFENRTIAKSDVITAFRRFMEHKSYDTRWEIDISHGLDKIVYALQQNDKYSFTFMYHHNEDRIGYEYSPESFLVFRWWNTEEADGEANYLYEFALKDDGRFIVHHYGYLPPEGIRFDDQPETYIYDLQTGSFK